MRGMSCGEVHWHRAGAKGWAGIHGGRGVEAVAQSLRELMVSDMMDNEGV